MDCPSCHSSNADDARFCSECGQGLGSQDDSPPAGLDVWVVGRSPDARVQIDLDSVSWEHLAAREESGRLLVRDLGSTNGTAYSMGDSYQQVTGDELAVDPKGVLMLGSHRLPVSLLMERLGLSPRSPTPVTVDLADHREPVSVGRDPRCDLVLDDPLVSRKHLLITREKKGWRVKDLGSVNGTWVDGRRIQDEVVQTNATLSLGSWELRLAPARIQPEPLRGQIRLDVEAISKRVKGINHPLISDVTFTVFPSEIVGILGDSGAGKTTLLQVIAAVEYASGGRVLLNGLSIADHFDRFRGLIGYVPQDDIVHPELTPYQALFYSARLRLPSDTTDAEIDHRVDQVLADLDLLGQRDVPIGDVQDKTLSGGQRKRVNLGMELVTDPLILFADEPTSGLSYGDSEEVLAALRKVADKGRPVVVSIHQPSGSLYHELDLALILGRGGRMAFFGPTTPDSYRFFGAAVGQPETIFRRLGAEPLDTWIERYEGSDTRHRWVTERQGKHIPDSQQPPQNRRGIQRGRGLYTLVSRLLRLKLHSPKAWVRYLVSPLIILALMLVIYRGVTGVEVDLFKRANPLFFLAMSALFFGLFNAATEVAAERPIFRRERLAGLGVGSYLLSKVIVLGLLTCAQVAIMSLPALWILRFDGSPWVQMGALLLTGMVALATGLLLSSLAPRPETALILVPIILIGQMLLAGFIEPIRSPAKRLMGAPMAIRWSTELLLHTEYDHLDPGPTLLQPATQREKWRALYVENRGYRFHSKAQTFGWLALLGLSYLLLAALALWARDPPVLRRRHPLADVHSASTSNLLS